MENVGCHGVIHFLFRLDFVVFSLCKCFLKLLTWVLWDGYFDVEGDLYVAIFEVPHGRIIK